MHLSISVIIDKRLENKTNLIEEPFILQAIPNFEWIDLDERAAGMMMGIRTRMMMTGAISSQGECEAKHQRTRTIISS